LQLSVHRPGLLFLDIEYATPDNNATHNSATTMRTSMGGDLCDALKDRRYK
jgi:hypothetical protein